MVYEASIGLAITLKQCLQGSIKCSYTTSGYATLIVSDLPILTLWIVEAFGPHLADKLLDHVNYNVCV